MISNKNRIEILQVSSEAGRQDAFNRLNNEESFCLNLCYVFTVQCCSVMFSAMRIRNKLTVKFHRESHVSLRHLTHFDLGGVIGVEIRRHI